MTALTVFLVLACQSAPKRSTVGDALEYLTQHQNADGTWGGTVEGCRCPEADKEKSSGDVETTALALLTFLGAGYGPRSELHGTRVKRSLDRLEALQEKLGAFDPKDPVADAIAAYAVCEAFALNDPSRKTAAQAAIDRVVIWAPTDVRGIVWKGIALKSAQVAGLASDLKLQKDNLKKLEGQSGSLAEAGRVMLSVFTHVDRKGLSGDALLAKAPRLLDPETCYVTTQAAYQLDGWEGPTWKTWREPLKSEVRSRQRLMSEACVGGSWDGQGLRERIRATAYRALMFEITYATGVVWGPD